MTTRPFDSVCALAPTSDGRFHADIDPSWHQGRGAFGGLVMALLLRAMRSSPAGEDSARAFRTFTCHFCVPAVGAVDIRVEPLRIGRGVSHISARMLGADGSVFAFASASLGRPRAVHVQEEDFDHAAAPPELATPASSLEELASMQRPGAPAFTRHFAFKLAGGTAPFAAGDQASFSGWTRYRGEVTAFDDSLIAAYLDAWPPALFARLKAPRPTATVALTIEFRRPFEGAQPGVAALVSTSSTGARDGYSAQTSELWSPDGALLARGHQVVAVIR